MWWLGLPARRTVWLRPLHTAGTTRCGRPSAASICKKPSVLSAWSSYDTFTSCRMEGNYWLDSHGDEYKMLLLVIMTVAYTPKGLTRGSITQSQINFYVCTRWATGHAALTHVYLWPSLSCEVFALSPAGSARPTVLLTVETSLWHEPKHLDNYLLLGCCVGR